MLQANLHDAQGHTIDAEQARKVIQYLDDMIRLMGIQIRTRQDSGYLPFVDTLPPAQDDEGDERLPFPLVISMHTCEPTQQSKNRQW